jgi:hypothetical protein
MRQPPANQCALAVLHVVGQSHLKTLEVLHWRLQVGASILLPSTWPAARSLVGHTTDGQSCVGDAVGHCPPHFP